MSWNVWRFGRLRPRYYITHPWKWIRDFCLSVKWAWQRSVRGYADIDWFNLCDWITGVMAPMFEDYAERHFGYPGGDAGFTDVQWTEYLREIARHLRNASEDQTEQVNQYEDDWNIVAEQRIKTGSSSQDDNGRLHITWAEPTEEQQEIHKKYIDREFEIADWKLQEAQKAMRMIGEHFFSLWD